MDGLDNKSRKFKDLGTKLQNARNSFGKEKFEVASELYEEVCTTAKSIEDQITKSKPAPKPGDSPKQEGPKGPLLATMYPPKLDGLKKHFPPLLPTDPKEWKTALNGLDPDGTTMPPWAKKLNPSGEPYFVYRYKIGRADRMFVEPAQKAGGTFGAQKSKGPDSKPLSDGRGVLYKKEESGMGVNKKDFMMVFVSPVNPKEYASQSDRYVWMAINKEGKFSEDQYEVARKQVYYFVDNHDNYYVCCPGQQVTRGTFTLDTEKQAKPANTVKIDRPSKVTLKLWKGESKQLIPRVREGLWEFGNDQAKLIVTLTNGGLVMRLDLGSKAPHPHPSLAEQLKSLTGKPTEEVLRAVNVLADVHESKLVATNERGLLVAEVSLKVEVSPKDAPAVPLILPATEPWSGTMELPPHLAAAEVYLVLSPI